MGYIEKIEEIIKCQYTFRNILEGNEAQTRWMLIDPLLLDCLGYSRYDIIIEYNIDTEQRVNKYNKLDYCIYYNNKPKILIEAKSLGINLYEKYNQLKEYFESTLKIAAYCKSELIGILTDGDTYLFYTNSNNEDLMDNIPYYSIKLSESEDIEKLKLLEYEKIKLSELCNSDLIYDEEYELNTNYRIDLIDNVFSYFQSKGLNVCINNVYLNGRLSKLTNLRSLYRNLLTEIDSRCPDLLYNLAVEEDKKSKGIIGNLKFSCNHINSTNIRFFTRFGYIYISIPTSRKSIINRIIYLAKVSNYGIHNISISLKENKSF